jgi:N-acetylglucosamine kinase-like BadF-type ATPase
VAGALVLGADSGGTSTRVVVADADGRVVGRGVGEAGNPVAGDPAAAAAALGAAAREALAGHEPRRVVAALVGVAGAARLAEPAVAAAYRAQWMESGLCCPLWTVGDAVAAFAAGTPAASGTVLIAGTGAVAATITDRTVTRTADGLGWLLGDEGSGFWLGLAAARLAVRALYGQRPSGGLVDAVCAHVGSRDADTVVTRLYQLPRSRIAAMAPAVSRSARAGDPAARRILREAADLLVDTLVSLRPGPGPIVLAGGVLTACPEVRDAVRAGLRARLGRSAVVAGDPALGAAWLAARRGAGLDPAAADALHRRMLGPAVS